MNYLMQRRTNLLKFLKEDGVEVYLITNPINVYYLTGFTGDSSYLIHSAKHTILVTDSRFEDQIAEECPGLDVHIRPHNKTVAEAAAEVLAKMNAKSVGVESTHLTLVEFESLKSKATKQTLVPNPPRVESLRAIKDPSELEKITDAVQIAEKAFKMFVTMIQQTETEKAMTDRLESYIRSCGGRSSSFTPIVAVGERGALPHAPPTSKTLIEGSKLLVDWGADVLYKSDITRTLINPQGANPSRRNKHERAGYKFDEIYRVVQKAHEAAVAVIRHGVAAKEVDAAARKVISDAGYGDFFTHGLGHGIGLEIHEAPRVRANSEDILQAGMVITIEPGIYISGQNDPKGKNLGGWGGVRLEDDYLVTKDGSRKLTTLPHDPKAIE